MGRKTLQNGEIVEKSDCLIILGMHRSGTSALSGCMHLLGVNLGENMMGPNQSNPVGYWEYNDIVAVHEVLLRDLDCNWNMVGALPADWLKSEAADKAKQSIRHLLDVHYKDKGLWAIKDPRMCRLMPLWFPLLDELDIQPGMLLTVRHPLEVAQSLAKRDGFSLRKGLLLWLVHNRDAFVACQDRPNIIITYDQLLSNPVTALEAVSKKLEITYPKSLQHRYLDILNFVQPDLKSQHTGTELCEKNSKYDCFTSLYDHIRCLTSNFFSIGRDSPDFSINNKEFSSFSLFQPANDNRNGSRGEITTAKLFDELLIQMGEQEREWHSFESRKERHLLEGVYKQPLSAQVFFPKMEKPHFTEECSRTFLLSTGQWQKITCSIPNSSAVSRVGIRFDPLNTNGVAYISSISLINKSNGIVLFNAVSSCDFEKLRIAGHAFRLPDQKDLTIFVFGHDPQIFLPNLPDAPDCPLDLCVWIKIQTDQEVVQKVLLKNQSELKSLKKQLEEFNKNKD